MEEHGIQLPESSPLSWEEPEEKGELENEGFSSEGEWAGQHRRNRGAGTLETQLGDDGSEASRAEVLGSPSVAGMEVARRACSLAALSPTPGRWAVSCGSTNHSIAWLGESLPPPQHFKFSFQW